MIPGALPVVEALFQNVFQFSYHTLDDLFHFVASLFHFTYFSVWGRTENSLSAKRNQWNVVLGQEFPYRECQVSQCIMMQHS
jgi:hypothetical protein